MTTKVPDYIIQELRHLLSVHCKETVYGDAADGQETKGQLKLMEKVFHGSGGYASVLDKFLKGDGEYAKCFHKVPMQNNREGNEQRVGTTHMLQLLTLLHCDDETTYIVHERGFTREALAETKGEMLPGRTLGEKANGALANYKFALKFTNQYMTGNPYPSGKGFEDLCLCVRQQMFLRFKGGKSQKTTKKKDVTVADMPKKYFFHGYMAWALYCPYGLSDKGLSCISADGKNVPPKGRKAARERVADVKAKARQMDSSGDRGVSMNDPHVVAAVRDASRNCRELFSLAMTDETNTLKQIDQVEQMLLRAAQRGGNEKLIEAYERRQVTLFNHLDEVAERKKRLSEESERLLGIGKKPRVSTVGAGTTEEMSTITVTTRTPSTPSQTAVTNTQDTEAEEPNLEETQLSSSRENLMDSQPDSQPDSELDAPDTPDAQQVGSPGLFHLGDGDDGHVESFINHGFPYTAPTQTQQYMA